MILHKSELSSRLTKWAIKLIEHGISYQAYTAIKVQVLVDFITNFSPNMMEDAQNKLQKLNEDEDEDAIWQLLVDGSSTINGSGLGIILTSSQGDMFQQPIHHKFPTTDNKVEYKVLIKGLNRGGEET